MESFPTEIFSCLYTDQIIPTEANENKHTNFNGSWIEHTDIYNKQ